LKPDSHLQFIIYTFTQFINRVGLLISYVKKRPSNEPLAFCGAIAMVLFLQYRPAELPLEGVIQSRYEMVPVD